MNFPDYSRYFLAQPNELVSSLGYLGIFISIFVLPFPPEIILPLAGFMAAQGKLNLIYVVISGVMGSAAGALPWYYAGRYIGEKRLKAWTQKHARWIKLSGKDVRKAKRWIDKSGNKAILLSQSIPGVRTLIALPAGMSGMNLGLFLLQLALSAIVWQGLLASAGYLLGSQYGQVHQYLNSFSHFVILVMVTPLIFWLLRGKS